MWGGTKLERKLARSQMRAWAYRHLQTVQNGVCPLCHLPIDMKIKGEGVIDHDHDTGRIRGVLHRSCNSAEGKVSNAAARWGAKSSAYPDIIKFLEATVAYLKMEPTCMIYPMHKTPEEKAEAAKQKRRVRAVQKRAAQRVKEVQ